MVLRPNAMVEPRAYRVSVTTAGVSPVGLAIRKAKGLSLIFQRLLLNLPRLHPSFQPSLRFLDDGVEFSRPVQGSVTVSLK